MDVNLARTFLAVVETGSFIEAAKRVHVTQSTVSMRIKVLEEQLGKRLFERSKTGARLTPAGVMFEKHALAMVRVWEHARLEISLPENVDAAVTVGGQYSLWEGFLFNWVLLLRDSEPNIAVKAQMGFSSDIVQRLVDGTLDIGVIYTPQVRPGFDIEQVIEDELVLVTNEADPVGPAGGNYVFVDWGPEFRADHSLHFPDITAPALYLELGSLGLRYILEGQGSAYFPRRLVEQYLKNGRLKLFEDAPVFHYPAYVMFSSDGDPKILEPALNILRQVASARV